MEEEKKSINNFIASGHRKVALNVSISLEISPNIAHLTLARVVLGLHLNCREWERIQDRSKREEGKEKEVEDVLTTDPCVVWSIRQWPQVKDI